MLRFVAVLAALLMNSSMATGQESRYVPIPFDGNFENQFRARLQAAKDQGALFNQIMREAKKFNIDLAPLIQPDWLNPELLGKLREYAHKDKRGATLSKADQEAVNNLIKKNMRKEDLSSWPQHVTLPEPALPVHAPVPRSDALDRWMREFVKRTEDTRLGDWLRNSPSFQKGITDLRILDQFEKSLSTWGVDNLPKHLRFPDGLNLDLGRSMLDGLSKFSFADSPRFDLPQVNLPHWGVPHLGLRRLGLGDWGVSVPRLPGIGGAGGARMGEALLWGLVVALVLVLAWHLVKSLGMHVPAPPMQAEVGPWPVDPAKITTSTELIKAFDYLAVLVLGRAVRTWNHRAIARKLADTTLHRSAAHELALSYEKARYAPDQGPLSVQEQVAVRRHVCILAGVPAS